MKKKLSSLLIKLALTLYLDNKKKLPPSIVGYTTGKVGISVMFGKKELKDFMKRENTSRRVAHCKLINECITYVQLHIAKAIVDMIEFEVVKGKNGAKISGHVKVYKKND